VRAPRGRDGEAQSRDARPADGRGSRIRLRLRCVVRHAGAVRVPKPILDKISREVAAAMHSPDVYDRLTKQGLEVENNTPEVFEAVIQSDMVRYGKMLRDAGLAVN